MKYILSLFVLMHTACADNLNYAFNQGTALVCDDQGNCDNTTDKNGGETVPYTEDLQWSKTHYQTLSIKHVALKKSLLTGAVSIGSNDEIFSVWEEDSSDPQYSIFYSENNFDGGMLYGTYDMELSVWLDGEEEYYTEQTLTLMDFDYFSPYNVASFSDGAIQKDGLIGGFNVYSNNVVTKDGSSLVSGFNAIVSY